ncbi:MAG TPA: TetR/AcrR family transcriptional regulator [Nocardioidaceae bacterium]|nr:TetR/AcrR family transcriptional regulator [Nocardioidaceae bacterium]
MPQAAPPHSEGRLSLDDWTARALALLLEEGPAAVTVQRLCTDLGVTKGSFYWHFADRAALTTAIARRWVRESHATMARLEEIEGLPPADRLRAITVRLLDPSTYAVERSLRTWARTEPSVASVIAEGDVWIVTLVASTLLELGLAPEEARMRAGVLHFAAIGFAHGEAGLPHPTEADVDRLVGWVTRP